MPPDDRAARISQIAAELGRLGGYATLSHHGREHYVRAGRKGGLATRASHNGAWYAELAHRAAASRRAKKGNVK